MSILLNGFALALAASTLPIPLLTKSGLPKRRTTFEDKKAVLGHGAPPQATDARIGDFLKIFAFRYTDAIVTKAGLGPRAWTRLPQALDERHVVRHLLADRIPGLDPIWFGARSFDQSRFICIDVDAVRPSSARKAVLPGTSFQDRCSLVERAFRRMGIDATNPRHALLQATPSGGRHYYVFFDAPYQLSQLHDLLEAAGLRHKSGDIEFFPSPSKGLRLPFGHVPGQIHDPNAWMQFVDDYRFGRIRLFSLAELFEKLDQHRGRWARQGHAIKSRREAAKLHPPKSGASPMRQQLGLPKARQDALERYSELLENGIQSRPEAEELMAIGIRSPGTRTAALNLLAAHWVWFRQRSAAEAANILTTWAMSEHHESKDIARDLERGTQKVATQISRMTRWYESHKRQSSVSELSESQVFAIGELASLAKSLAGLDASERHEQAVFLLHFLRFAKTYGTVSPDGTWREAAPAVAAVIKRWPGCRHGNDYKVRMNRAIAAGILVLVKEKWQNPKGAGRARTYRFVVAASSSIEKEYDYATALELLTTNSGSDSLAASTEAPYVPGNETRRQENGRPKTKRINHQFDHASPIARRSQPTTISEESSRKCVDTRPRQRNSESPKAASVSCQANGKFSAISTSLASQVDLPIKRCDSVQHGGDVPSWPVTTQSGQKTSLPIHFADKE